MDFSKLQNVFDDTDAAPEYEPIPAGEYEAGLVSGAFMESKQGTPGYTITFEIRDGGQAGRRLTDTLWLTPAAIPFTKRDLSKIGITSFEQMKRPVPAGIVCRLRVALRRDDDGTEYNKVRSWEPVRLEQEMPSTGAHGTNGSEAASTSIQGLETPSTGAQDAEPDEQQEGDEDEIIPFD